MVTLCAPDFLTICGQQYQSTDPFLTHVCPDGNWRGCDSTVLVDLAILNPQVNIEDPPIVGCGPTAEVVLNASSSDFSQVPGGTVTMLWTGPGILGQADGPMVTINAGGVYCFTITTTRNGVSCIDQECVTVQSNIQLPQTPQLSGNQSPCQGSTFNYSVTPVGSPAPTGYVWTTPGNIPFNVINANTIAITWPANFTTGNLCVASENDCGLSVPVCIPITAQAGPPVPVLSGPTTVCANNQTQVFTVTNATAGVIYNWQVPAGATFTGSGPSITVNFSGTAAGNGQVCVTSQNTCGTGQPVCTNFTITAVPAVPDMSGPVTVCSNGGTYTYTVNNPPPGVTYAWTVPAGATITGATNGPSITVNFNGASNGQVCVAASNSCGTSNQDCQPVQVTNAPTATISGSGDICAGSNETVDLTIVVSGTGPWDVSYSLNNGPATNIIVTTSPYTLTVNQAGTYTLTAVNIQGSTCTGTPQGSAVVTQNPAPQATLSGTGEICQGSGQTVPLTINFTGTSPWNVEWTLNGTPQAPFQATTNPYTWNLGEAQAGTIQLSDVVDGNGCNGNATGSGSISINDAPTVSGISAECEATNQFYVVTFTINGGDVASYSVTPSNGTLVGNLFTSNQIPTGTGYNFIVSDANNCDVVTVSQNIVLCDCDSEVGTMDIAMVEVCGDGPTAVQYNNAGEFLDGNDTLAFVLHNGNGLSIVNPVLNTSSTPSVSFNASNMTYGTTYYLSAVVGDASGNGVNLNDPCLSVAQGTPIVFYQIPTASIVGTDAVCVGEPGQLQVQFTGVAPYSISYDDGNGNVQTLNGITQNPYTLVVSPTGTTTYCLTAMSDNNCVGTVTGCGDVVVNSAVVVDSFNVECNLTSTAYTVTVYISGGNPSSYSVTGLPGTITGNVFISNPVPNLTGFSIVVNDGNNCNPQTVAQTLVNCACQTDAGTMSATLVSVCGNGPVAVPVATGTFTDADDIISYVLRPDNSAFLGTIISTSNTPSFSFVPATMTYGTTYYVSAIAGNDNGSGSVDLNDPCLNVSNSTPVVFNQIPTAVLNETKQICVGDNTTLEVMLTGQSPWTIIYQPTGVGATPVTIVANSSPFQLPINPTSTTTYNLVSVESGNACVGTVSGTGSVVVNNPPTGIDVERICDLTGQTFVVSFTIQDGDPLTYTVTPPGTLVGSLYTSTALPSGASYSFAIDDINNCGPSLVAGSHACDCETDLGTMSTTLVQACVDEMVTVPSVSSQTLDPDDVLVYYLHTGSSNVLGTVIGTNGSPSFSYNGATMTAGTTYYISAVAGTNNGSGGVDLQNDPCAIITLGTPIRFNVLPNAILSGSITICEGETANMSVTVSGVGPFSVVYSINAITQPPVTMPAPGTYPIQLPGGLTAGVTSIVIISIADNGTGCDNTPTQSSIITVTPNVGAGTSIGDLEFCEGLGQAFDLDNQLTGATPGGQWTGGPTGGVVAGGNVNPTNFAPGTYQYTYTVQGAGNCPDDTESINLIINPAPDADAGIDQILTCDKLVANLGGTNTTNGANYTWSGGTVVNPNAATTTTTAAGTYTLTVESQGCVATDDVEVIQSAAIPNLSIVISDVSCFGNNDGFVRVDSVWGGVGPYLFSLDGSPFSSTTQFTNLGDGPHTIQVVDAGGCENESAFTVEEPVEVTVEIMGNFESTNSNIVNLGDELVLSILSTPPSSELDSILWSTQGLDSCQGCPSITVAPTQQTTYTVLVDEGGCTDSDDITVIVAKDRPVYVPNAFSPNDDGINDLFKIYGGKSVSSIKSFLVFDRWGETVYEYYNFIPSDPVAGWDGKHRDAKMQPAVFTWFAEVEFTDGRIELYRGDVSLVR
ncbi:MAG: gliding motility-associated C-terminal domain-containing protein [Saprospiraceae bacterium]|nr:gliding motility-associated C-terminal domain-containing protein [Saprospiraceae bacterium]